MKLQIKIWLGVGAMIALIMGVDVVVSARSTESEVLSALDNDARTIRALLMATRRVYHQQFLDSGVPLNDKTIGFLPAHAISRIASDFPNWMATGMRFNNVSDRPRNPSNQADADELAAMQWFRVNPKASDHITEIRTSAGSFYHFTAPIWIEPYCLKCHGERNTTPAPIQEAYTEAYDYQLGELRGVMSIRLPMDELRVRARSAWGQRFGVRAVGYSLLLVLLGLMMQRLVVRRLAHLKTVTQQLAQGDLSVQAQVSGNDEISHLGTCFNDMASALAHQHRQLQRLTQAYSALSETNQTIVRVDSEDELRHRVCQIAVDFGGMALAWLAQLDATGQRLTVAQCAGAATAYLENLSITLNPPNPEDRDPSARAWHSGQPVIVQDYFSAPTTQPWHERARRFGWAGCASLPILRGGTVYWVLNLYHLEKNAFDQKMQSLLAEMAIDIGFALDKIDLQLERERKNIELLASEAKYRAVVETSQDGFWRTDSKGTLLEVNDAYVAFSGYSREELLRMHISDLEADQSVEQVQDNIKRVMAEGHALFESRHRTKCGELRAVEISTSFSNNNVDAADPHFTVFVRDLSLRNEAEDRIERLSHFDMLTGLPNRSMLANMVRQAIGQAQRQGGSLALLFIDVDHFKNINDSLGHRIGDMLLIELADNFKSALRAEDVLSRLGGDEFLLLLSHADAQNAARVVTKLFESISHAMNIDGHQMQVTCSAGIALYPGDGDDFDTLLQHADTAVHSAKLEGRNAYRFFTVEMQHSTARTLQLEAALRRALERNELLLHYQPQVCLTSGRIVGVEALVRWQHPELGMVGPAEFIPLAESTGLILPIGEWVLETALAQLKCWIDAGFDLNLVAVNLSAHQFRLPNLPTLVADILGKVGLPAHRLELELTESVTIENPTAAVAMMEALHQQGVRIAIDDFGTGYSSLSYLKRFPIDKLKIDQSFVRDLTRDPEGEAIVRTIIGLASSLKFRTIAEGVEKPEQLAFLKASHCHEVQGYLFSRPLPAAELEDWLRAWRSQQVTG